MTYHILLMDRIDNDVYFNLLGIVEVLLNKQKMTYHTFCLRFCFICDKLTKEVNNRKTTVVYLFGNNGRNGIWMSRDRSFGKI